MFETKLSELFNKIAYAVNEIIPIVWEDFYLKVEIKEDDGEVLFYFNTAQNPDEYIYSHDIPTLYNIPFEEYMDTFNRLMNISRSILRILEENDQPKWYGMTLVVKSRKHLKVEFDYTDWYMSPFSSKERLDYFKYKFLGKQAENDEQNQKFLEMEAYQKQFND